MGVHGWRLYDVECSEVEEQLVLQNCTLVGMKGLPIKTARSTEAECGGYDASAMWITEETKAMADEDRHPEGSPSPQYHCTCGYYGYRLWPRDRAQNIIFAHVTCVHPADQEVENDVVIHAEGWRARWYKIDYIIQPSLVNMPLVEIMASLANRMKVTVMPFDHPDGCKECFSANLEGGRGPRWHEAWTDGRRPDWVKET